MSEPVTAVDHSQLALQRLAASRARLREVLLPPAPSRASAFDDSDTMPHGTLFKRLRALLRAAPPNSAGHAVVSLLTREAQRWWARQPWHQSAEVVGHAVIDSAAPLVRKHPLAAVALAAAAGAALVRLWPSQWHAVGARVKPMGRHLGDWVWEQLKQAPVQMTLAGALATWLNAQREAAPASTRREAAPASTQREAAPAAAASSSAPTHESGVDEPVDLAAGPRPTHAPSDPLTSDSRVH